MATHINDIEREKLKAILVGTTKNNLLDLRKAYLIFKGYEPTRKGWIAWANAISGLSETNFNDALYAAYSTLSTRSDYHDVRYDFIVNDGLA